MNSRNPRSSHRKTGAPALWAAVPLVFASACSSFDFKPREEIPGMRALAADKAAYPSERLTLTAGEIDGKPIHLVAEEIRGAPTAVPAEASNGAPPRRQVLVFLHGVLSNRGTWDYVAGYLGAYYDMLLLDLPGCGESDKPDGDDLGPNPYNPDWIADTVMTALEEYVRIRGDDVQFILVGHSFGGTVVLRMLAEPGLRQRHAALRDRFGAAVLLAPVDVTAVARVDPDFESIATLSDFETFFGRLFGILSSRTNLAVYRGTTDPETMPEEDWLRLYHVISNSETRRPAQWMLRNTVALKDNKSIDWPVNKHHADHYTDIEVPCLILWGHRDETMEASMGYKLQSHIQGSELVILPRSMHTLPSERPVVVAKQIVEFLDRRLPSGALSDAEDASTMPAPVRELPIADIDASDRFKRGGIRQESP